MRRLRVMLLGGVLALASGLLLNQVVWADELAEPDPPIIIASEEVLTEPDFTPTPPQLKFIKFQLEDSTRAEECQTAAEFALVRNFGDEAADLGDVVLQIDGWKKTLTTTSQTIEPGHFLVLYNRYFVGAGVCATDAKAVDWLAQQNQKLEVRSLKSGIFNSGIVKLIYQENVIDEVDLGALRVDKTHDTLVAQTSSQAEIILQNGQVVWRSLRAHIPEQHWLSYDSLVLYEEVEPEPKNLCQGLVLSEIAVNIALDKQFIEVYNPTDEIVDLKGCRLWTSWSGASEHGFDDVELLSQQYLAVFLKDTKLQLSRTDVAKIELRNELGDVVDELTLEAQTPNSSQIRINDEFIKTFALTPNLPNIELPELPCSVGYGFNQTTGSCQKIAVVNNTTDEEMVCEVGYEVGYTGTCVKVCAEGYERNPDTNRCRKIVDELETTLAPCPVGYERNPETNRCRKITTTTQAGLAPCPIGYERNLDTNRCRKISNQQDCDDGYEIGFTGTCVKKCDDGYERSAETNRCRKLVAQASESDVAGAFSTLNEGDNTPVVKLQWWQVALGAGVVVSLGLIYQREAVVKWLKGLRK